MNMIYYNCISYVLQIDCYTLVCICHVYICNRYLIQNSQAVKKVCGPQKAMVKKDVKSKVAAKKWL